jgi:hypothetical protein
VTCQLLGGGRWAAASRHCAELPASAPHMHTALPPPAAPTRPACCRWPCSPRPCPAQSIELHTLLRSTDGVGIQALISKAGELRICVAQAVVALDIVDALVSGQYGVLGLPLQLASCNCTQALNLSHQATCHRLPSPAMATRLLACCNAPSCRAPPRLRPQPPAHARSAWWMSTQLLPLQPRQQQQAWLGRQVCACPLLVGQQLRSATMCPAARGVALLHAQPQWCCTARAETTPLLTWTCCLPLQGPAAAAAPAPNPREERLMEEHPAARAAAAAAAAGVAGPAAAAGAAEQHEEGQQQPDAPVLVQTPLVRQLLLLQHPFCTVCPPACLLSMLAARLCLCLPMCRSLRRLPCPPGVEEGAQGAQGTLVRGTQA